MQVNAVLLFLGELGGGEILVILVVVLLFFGAKRIPEFARSLGSGIREFKDAVHGMRNELERSGQDEEPPAASSTHYHPAGPETPFAQPQEPGSDTKPNQTPEAPFRPEV